MPAAANEARAAARWSPATVSSVTIAAFAPGLSAAVRAPSEAQRAAADHDVIGAAPSATDVGPARTNRRFVRLWRRSGDAELCRPRARQISVMMVSCGTSRDWIVTSASA